MLEGTSSPAFRHQNSWLGMHSSFTALIQQEESFQHVFILAKALQGYRGRRARGLQGSSTALLQPREQNSAAPA